VPMLTQIISPIFIANGPTRFICLPFVLKMKDPW
jgi:hypothetical protein